MEPSEKQKNVRFGPTAVAAYFAYVGVFGLIAGYTHLTNLLSNFSGIVLGDTLFNSLAGIFNFISAYLLWKKRSEVIWVYGSYVLLTLLYAPLVGRGFNFIGLFIGGFVLALLFSFNKNQVFENQVNEALDN